MSLARRVRLAAFKARRAWNIARGAFIATRAMFRMIDLIERGGLERAKGGELERILAAFGDRRRRVFRADPPTNDGRLPLSPSTIRPETDEEIRKRLREMFSRNERRMTHDRKPKP